MTTTLDPSAIERLKEWGGPKLASKMVRLFLDTSPERVAQVRQAFTGGDLREAERGAHSLKSSAANLGATRLQEISAEMERLLGEEDVDEARSLFEQFEQTHSQAIEALEALEQVPT